MREGDEEKHPAAIARERKENIRFWAGLVIAAAGIFVALVMEKQELGLGVALIGSGIVPFEKFNPFK